MKTPDDIKKGLQCCINDGFGCSEKCPYFNSLSNGVDCEVKKHSDSLTYIQQLESQVPKWINIRDCLPGLREKVLFTPMCNEGAIYIGELNYVGEYGAAYFAVRNGKRKICYSATHWMPLPEPPKEDDHATD